MKYNPIGIQTTIPRDGEVCLEQFEMHCTDHGSNPFGIQWMRYGKYCTHPMILQELAHIAFQVEDLEKALEGIEFIIQTDSPSQGVTLAFMLENGAPVELLEFNNPPMPPTKPATY